MQVLNQAQTSLISGGVVVTVQLKPFGGANPTPMPAPITPVEAPVQGPDCEWLV